MKEIVLTQGKVSPVDDCNFEWLNQFKWSARLSKSGHWYAMRTIHLTNGEKVIQYMHRAIMGDPKGMEIDHKNGDGLCNLEENLRVASHGQNQMNKRKTGSWTSSKYKGVCWNKQSQKWQANIKLNGKSCHLGLFTEEQDAALAYNAAAIKHHGEFGFINPLPPQEQPAQIAA